MKKKNIILIDGNYCLYQTYFSFKKLKNDSKHPTGVLYGYIKILNILITKFYPKKIIIAFDSSVQTFRHKLYKKYKINRPAMPDDLKKQISPLKKIIQYLGIPAIKVNNFEADDIIGTLSDKFIKKKYYVLIYSADKDMLQLINKNVSIIPGTIKKDILNQNDVYKKFGIKSECIADFLGLVGDISDNIPGVPGIGKKTAAILLKNFLSVKKIYQNISQISTLKIRNYKKIIINLKKNKNQALLSSKLTTIDKNIKLDNLHDIFQNCQLNLSKLKKKLKYYQLEKYLQDIDLNQFPIINIYHKKKNKKKKIEITNKKILTNIIKKIIKKKIFSIAITFRKKNFFIAITLKKNYTWWYSCNSTKKKNKEINKKIILKMLKPILENNKYKKIGNDLKKIFWFFKKFNITLHGMYFDLSIINYFYQLQNKNNQKLKNIKKKKNTEYFKKKKINFLIQDTLISFKRYDEEKKKYIQNFNKQIFQLIDMPLLTVLTTIENNGVLIKKTILKKQKKKITKTIKKIKKNIYLLNKKKFNINSLNQLKKILFDKYHLPHILTTKKGQISINDKVLEKLSKIHKLPKMILQYRILNKIKNTYLKNLINSINKKTKRIHTTYHQTSTSTGRLSSSNPNLQNIPIKTKLGRKIRIAFIVKKKWLLITADYSHIELKIIAHYSQDKNLIQDLSKNNDVHKNTASHIFKLPTEKILPLHRNIAKTINFSILYGISPFGLSQKLNISILEARKYIISYFKKYKKLKKYIIETYNAAKKEESITTLFGRKIYIPNINSKNTILKKNAKRFCINSIIQNTASDIIKKAMIHIDDTFKKKFLNDAKIIMQIHDELIFEIKEEKKSILIPIIKYHMEQSTQLILPLNVVIKTGKNWKEIKKLC